MPLRHLDVSVRAAVRTASTTSLPRILPSTPFTASPAPDMTGALGQVRLPDMYAIERAVDYGPIIPLMPDAFGSRSNTASFPVLQPAKAYSTVADPQTHLGGGPSSTGNAAK
ncbi:uncharacterized protein JCM10292_006521 [Rhodotorula paludigena]|uniref:uncharacterized protein n=1 Tax=Rhodotorula paludigena TaxID=86838 RepID=UPI00317839D9